MNPSTFGWIAKILKNLDNYPYIVNCSAEHLYTRLKEVGFIYGNSLDIIVPHTTSITYTEEEQTKINLFCALLITYNNRTNQTHSDFITALLEFYGYLDLKKSYFSFINAIHSSKSEKLEKIIHTRIQTNESIFKKNFSHLLTNALLFIDILSFQHFLEYQTNPIQYATGFEETLTNIVFLALNSKDKKNDHDKLLIKLFAASVRYTSISTLDELSFDYMHLERYTDILEKRYILDLTSLAVWNDHKMNHNEKTFINALGAELGFERRMISHSVASVYAFIDDHKKEISFFNYSNPAQHFYNQTSRTVRLLVLRNKQRLIKEISKSKELVLLLGQSTTRELSKKEKEKVQKQLLDICKSIPSLAIFILPGGSLLLPLFIKFIPQLLPSAFNENK